MPYKVRCKECKEFIYILKIMEQKTNYPCPSCNFDNVFDKKQSSIFFGVEEIKVEDFPDYESEVKKQSDLLLKQEQTQSPIGSKTETLSQKYSILELYKGLAFLIMIATTGFFIYSLVQYSDAPKVAREMLENTMITSTVSYVITMFSLFCITMIINFLFKLDETKNNLEGKKTKYYENRQKKEEGTFKDGKRDGLWTNWYENGQKKEEITYKDGEIEGLWTDWYDNGQKETEGKYVDDKRHGLWTNWYENGQKMEEITYKDGKEIGVHTNWHEHGQKWIEKTFKDGQHDGLWTEWHWNGQKSRESTYKDGKQDGVSHGWHLNGKKEYEARTYKDGKLDGLWTRWTQEGWKDYERTYKDGKKISYKEFYFDGSIRDEREY